MQLGLAKFCRKSGEFANSIAAVVRDPDRDYARVVLGAVDGAPIVLEQTSSSRSAARAARVHGSAIADDLAAQERAFDDFKSSLHAAMTMRALSQALP